MARMMLVLGLVLSLAACGGSGTDGLSKADEDALEARVEKAEADKRIAEMATGVAEEDKRIADAALLVAVGDKDDAEADKRIADAALLVAVGDKDDAEEDKRIADAALLVAVGDKDDAEADKRIADAALLVAVGDKGVAEEDKRIADAALLVAVGDKDDAEEDKRIADAALLVAVGDKDDAEEEAQRWRLRAERAERLLGIAQDDVAAAMQQAAQMEARVALTGLRATPLQPPTSVEPRYNAPALVIADVTFTSPTGSSAGGGWYKTTLSNRGDTSQDDMVVYSDVTRGVTKAITDAYPGFMPIEDTNYVEIPINNDAHKGLVSSSQFPRIPSTKDFLPNQVDMPDDEPDTDQEEDRVRYFSGSFDGGSGHFSCLGTACTVQYTGENYILAGGIWTFRALKTRTVTVRDDQYMYFGWWRKEMISDRTFSYRRFSGEGATAGAALSGGGFTGLEGTAVYEGPAIGQYAIDAPLSSVSSHGSFNARARLEANFGNATTAGNISGSITRFNEKPGWAVTLQNATITDNGSIRGGGVSWTIDDTTEAALQPGTWMGEFHAGVDPYIDTYPTGVTGSFDANYGTIGRMIGAFGAHKTN